MSKEKIIVLAILAVVFFPVTIWLIRYIIALFTGIAVVGFKVLRFGKIGLVALVLIACFIGYVIYKFKYE